MGFGNFLKKALLNPLKMGARVAAAPIKMAHATNKRLIKGDFKGSLGAGLGSLKKSHGQNMQDFGGMDPLKAGLGKFLARKGGQLAGSPTAPQGMGQQMQPPPIAAPLPQEGMQMQDPLREEELIGGYRGTY